MEFIKKDETYKVIESLENCYIEGQYVIGSDDRVNIDFKVFGKEDNVVTEELFKVFVIIFPNKKDMVNISIAGDINNMDNIACVKTIIDNCIEHFNPFNEQ